MQVQLYQYNKYNCNIVRNSPAPSFGGRMNTMQEKFAVLFGETKKLHQTKRKLEIKDFEAIIKKISPTSSVKLFSEIPPGSNISPRTGAYFSQKTNISILTNEMSVDSKIIYLNLNNQALQSKLKILGDFIHEATHVSQEESTDRVSTIDFTKKMLHSPLSAIEKNNSLLGGIQGFNSVEYNILLPLIQSLRKDDELPCRILHADKNMLNIFYKNITNLSATEYIEVIIKEGLKQLKMRFPFMNDNYVLQYIHKKAGFEKEAYKNSLDFFKNVLKINGDTDLDLRILLYDEFEKITKNMIK